MKLSKEKSWAAAAIRFTFNPHLHDLYGTNLCPFFWTAVSAVLLAPLAAPYNLLTWWGGIPEDIGPPPILGAIAMAWCAVSLIWFGYMAWALWPYTAIVLAVFLIGLILFTTETGVASEVVSMTGNKLYGWYYDICPVIEWEE